MVLMELSLKLGTQSKDKEFFDLINFSFEAIDYMRRFMQFEIEPQELTKQKRLSRKCQKFVKKSIIIIEKMGLCDMVDSRTIMQMFNTGILLFNPTPLLLDGVREPLLAMGFKVYFATQVDSAFGLINKHSPFLILVDVNDDLKLAEDMIEEISQRDFRGFVYLVVDESTTESFCTINVNYSNILEKCFIAPFRFEDIYEEILEQKEVHDKNICVHF